MPCRRSRRAQLSEAAVQELLAYALDDRPTWPTPSPSYDNMQIADARHDHFTLNADGPRRTCPFTR